MFSFFRKNSKKVGIDMVEIARFKEYQHDQNHHFLHKVFLQSEIDYCFSFAESASHLAGMFSAKEAVSKALGTRDFPFIEIEIRHAENGRPEAYSKGKKLPISISITHTDTLGCAIAVA